MKDSYANRPVPPEYWSDQVRRLHPKSVKVLFVFEDDQKGVCLSYGGGFLHWTLVLGPPGARLHPSLNDPNTDSVSIRWTDGIYDWLQG